MRLTNDSPSFIPVHSQIKAIGPRDLHLAKGRGRRAAAAFTTRRDVGIYTSQRDAAEEPLQRLPPATLVSISGVISLSQPSAPLSRSPRQLPQGYSFHITLRCNSRQFLIAKGLRRDVLLAVLAKAQAKVPHRLYAVCLMANHLHLLLRPDDASELPKLMHWIGWYSAMALNRLSGRCGHFWEARYYATAIAPKDHRRVLNTLRYIHANPKAAGVRKGFDDPYSNYGHYGRLASDGINEWHPSFLQLAPTLKGCSKRYERFCQRYRHHAKGASKCHWGSRMLKRLVEATGVQRSKRRRVSPGQQQLPFAFDCRLNQIPENWHQIAVRFRRANGIRDGDRERSFW